MYNPFKRDRNYFEKTYDIPLHWPSESHLAEHMNETTNRFSSLKRVIVYRNIPNYIDFAKSLVSQGFSPIDITLNLAICTTCIPSLIFGDNVSVNSLQAVIRTLNSHNYPIDKIEYSQKKSDTGKILIGQTPGQDAKPFWSKIDALLVKNISIDTFVDTIGFTLNTPRHRAIALHQRAKNLIDYSFNTKSKKRDAREMLDTAMELDPTYIPTYIEIARSIIKSSRKYSEWHPSESAKQAKKYSLMR
ncbi:MAG: hypothetical protein JKY67_20215 [Pseudomonadales bacterium]|nr:hypothetical protein [Pseudomonadales bacterium]